MLPREGVGHAIFEGGSRIGRHHNRARRLSAGQHGEIERLLHETYGVAGSSPPQAQAEVAPPRPLIALEFPDPIPDEPAAGNRARLTDRVEVWIELWTGARFLLTVIPAGFVYDGVSRPGIFAWWIKRWGPEKAMALLHDWLLYLLKIGVIGKPKFLIDLFLLLALVAGGRSFFRSTVIFLAVRTRPARVD